MNYQIITDKKIFDDFVNWLPDLKDNECYYLCLFARSKYAKNEDGSNKFPHIKTDKNQLKRFVASDKRYIYHKIKQLECEFGSYKTKDGDDVPQESLALYITPNPRNQRTAMFSLMKRLVDIQISDGKNYNIHAEALYAIQRSKSRTVYVDFDIDSVAPDYGYIFDQVDEDACTFLKTRGGVHLLVDPKRVSERFRNTWYKNIKSMKETDSSSGNDTMIPVPGTFQGGHTPHFFNPLQP